MSMRALTNLPLAVLLTLAGAASPVRSDEVAVGIGASQIGQRPAIEVALAAAAKKPDVHPQQSTGIDAIKIATVGPMSGQYQQFGAELKRGAEQAVADLNARGGVLGRKVVLTVADDKCDQTTAITVAQQLGADKTALVAGHFCSGSSIAASAVYAAAKVIEISPASANPEYTEARPGAGVLRVFSRDVEQGTLVGAYIAKNFSGKKIAIVIDDQSSYSQGLAIMTRRALNAAGVREDLDDTYLPGTKDFSSLVAKMKDAAIDVAYISGRHSEVGLIVREMRRQRFAAQVIGSDLLATDEYWQVAGIAGEGTLMTFPADPRKNPAASGVVQEFRRRGIDSAGYVLYTYAAVEVWAEATEKAGSIDFNAVATELAKDTFATVLGDISFDAHGDVNVPSYAIYVWHHGKYSQL
jgi:branched-chain amino acid transport system substrate-binding protein